MASHKPNCKVSVIVPTFNRPRELFWCLEGLAAQDFSADDFEVIVADDAGSVDLQVALEPLPVTVVRLPENAGPGAARNYGAQFATGDLLAFTDDDCSPEPGWLSALWREHRRVPQALLGGRIINALPGNVCAEASQVISDLVYSHYNAVPDDAGFFSSNNIAVPRERFLAMGGFDAAFRVASEDREFCDRWLHAGGRLVFVSDAVVRHGHDLSFRRFARQHFSYGRGAHRYHQLRASRGSGRMAQDMAFHATLPGSLRRHLRARKYRQAVSLALLLVTWQIANAVGFFYEKARSLSKAI